jgi:ABC-2 type transport system permease protein
MNAAAIPMASRHSEAQRYLHLVRELAVTNFRLKYTGSVLGYLWSMMKPLAYFGILYVIFVDFFHQRSPSFPPQMFLAIVLFNFFTESTGTSLGAIAGNGHLVRKASFPLSALVVSLSVTALFTMAINLSLVMVIGTVWGKLHLGLRTLALPFLLAELYLLSLGVGMILASIFVFYRDLGHIWEVLTQFLLYAAGIVFLAVQVPVHYRGWFFLNPLAQIIEDARHAVVTPDAPWTYTMIGVREYLIPIAISLFVFVFGLWLFRRLNPIFAENL